VRFYTGSGWLDYEVFDNSGNLQRDTTYEKTFSFDGFPTKLGLMCGSNNKDTLGIWKITYEYYKDSDGNGPTEMDIYRSGSGDTGDSYGNNNGWCQGTNSF